MAGDVDGVCILHSLYTSPSIRGVSLSLIIKKKMMVVVGPNKNKKKKKKGQYERYILSIKYFTSNKYVVNKQSSLSSDLKVASKARQIVKTISEVRCR